jgi:N-acetylglutamate synthase-like GNAT family acetyltransferase
MEDGHKCIANTEVPEFFSHFGFKTDQRRLKFEAWSSYHASSSLDFLPVRDALV